MSQIIVLALCSTYVHPDGRLFAKGKEYEVSDADAAKLLARTSSSGKPYFARPKEPVVAEEKAPIKSEPPKDVIKSELPVANTENVIEPVIKHAAKVSKETSGKKTGGVKIVHKDKSGEIDTAGGIAESDANEPSVEV